MISFSFVLNPYIFAAIINKLFVFPNATYQKKGAY